MNRALLVFEDAGWRSLRPLTDLLPVPALRFGAACLASRWRRVANVPLLRIEARHEAMRAWSGAPAGEVTPDEPAEVLVVNAAALPGPWFDSVLEAGPPAVFKCAGAVVGARVSYAAVRPGLGRGTGFDSFLLGLGLPEVAVEARRLSFPWNLMEWNAEAITEDLDGMVGALLGDVHELAVVLEPARVAVHAGARVDPFAVLDARGGPILIEADAVVLPHTVIAGPCVVGAGTQLLGGFIGRSTIGPQCRIAGEVEECVWQGFANKRHHGFVGHSLIGEWVNLGALTTTSDLKNNYGSVRFWVDGQQVDSGVSKIGSLIGAHVKTGIGTLLPTGASIGVGSNLFAGGRFAPRFVPAFSWWGGERLEEHRLEAFLETARIAMSRRGRTFGVAEEAVLRGLFGATIAERKGDSVRAPSRSE